MADYTELKKQAQEIFTEMLSVCEEKIINFNRYKVCPILLFDDSVNRYGCCRCLQTGEPEKFNYEIILSTFILPSPERIIKETITHELAHVISKKPGHGKEFKKTVQIIDEIFGTNSEKTSQIDRMIVDEALFEFDKDLYMKHSDYHKKKEEKRLKRERKKRERLKEENERIRQLQIKYFGHELGNIPKS